MDKRRVFLIGNSLLTNGIGRILEDDPRITVLGSAATVDEALPVMADLYIEAIIIMGTDDQTMMRICPVLAQHPGVPILLAEISQNQVQLITCQNIEAKPGELLAVLAALPSRSM